MFYTQKDYILRQIELLAEGFARLIRKDDTSAHMIDEVIHESGIVSPAGYLKFALLSLINEGRICEAEDLLFEKMPSAPDADFVDTALDFYAQLSTRSDEFLQSHDFSRDEIVDGLDEIRRAYNIPVEEDE